MLRHYLEQAKLEPTLAVLLVPAAGATMAMILGLSGFLSPHGTFAVVFAALVAVVLITFRIYVRTINGDEQPPSQPGPAPMRAMDDPSLREPQFPPMDKLPTEGVSLTVLAGLVAPPPITGILGQNQAGEPLLLRLASSSTGHVLITGRTAANVARTLLTSLAMFNSQEALQLLLVDSGLEFGALAQLPHALGAQVSSHEETVQALSWLVREMDRRTAQRERRPAIIVAIADLDDLPPGAGGNLRHILEEGPALGAHVVACVRHIGHHLEDRFPVHIEPRLGADGLHDLVALGHTIQFRPAVVSDSDMARILRNMSENER